MARLRGRSKSASYRLLERATGRQLGAAGDRDAAFALLDDAREAGMTWDELELLGPDGESLMIRGGERIVDKFLPRSGRPVYYPTLAEAQAVGGWVVLEGDWGGQIFLTAPASMIDVSEERLRALLHEIDLEAWGRQGESSLGIHYVGGPLGRVMAGGMGGGVLLDDLWLHPELVQLGWSTAIRDALAGRLEALPIPVTVLDQSQLDALARAFDQADPRLRIFVASGPHDTSDAMDASINALLGPPPAADEGWYHTTICRALQNVRPSSSEVIRRWGEEAWSSSS
jgi:hypothetical protein